jgi:hypothetical protein
MAKKYLVENPAKMYVDGKYWGTIWMNNPTPIAGRLGKIQINSPAWQMLKLHPIKYFFYLLIGKFYK